jgi:hypothetical protein
MLMELDILSGGAEYISASRAAEKTGYASDYIGQLCRRGKIPGKLIDRTWYVDLEALLLHKKTRHLGKPRTKVEAPAPAPAPTLSIQYRRDGGPLLPLIGKEMVETDTVLIARTVSRQGYLAVVVLTGLMMTGLIPLLHLQGGEALTLQASAAEVVTTSFFTKVADPHTFFETSFQALRSIALKP